MHKLVRYNRVSNVMDKAELENLRHRGALSHITCAHIIHTKKKKRQQNTARLEEYVYGKTSALYVVRTIDRSFTRQQSLDCGCSNAFNV